MARWDMMVAVVGVSALSCKCVVLIYSWYYERRLHSWVGVLDGSHVVRTV